MVEGISEGGQNQISGSGALFDADKIAIRTMKNDLASPAAKAAPVVAAAGVAPQPAAPTPQAVNQVSPLKPKKKKGGIIFALLIFLILIGGGAVAWFMFRDSLILPGSEPRTPPTQEVATIDNPLDIIPSTADIILHYNLSQPTHRQRIQRLWESGTNQTRPSTADLLTGNPAGLLEDPELTDIYYVVLVGNPRPFLIVNSTPQTDQLASQQREEQVIQKNNWYILHPLETASYETALQAGTASQSLDKNIVTTDFSAHWIFSTGALSSIHPHLGHIYASPQEFTILNSQIDASGERIFFTNDSIIRSSNSSAGTSSETALLASLPNDAQSTWTGRNFAEDIQKIRLAGHLNADEDVLSNPAVSALLEGLTGPFTYYKRQGEDRVEDIGLVVQLPQEETAAALEVGDQGLETALTAIIPRIIGRTISNQITFQDGLYRDAPLRFVNLINSHQALDYSIVDGKLLVASSKEGLLKLMDTALLQSEIGFGETNPWQTLLSQLPFTPPTNQLVTGYLSSDMVKGLLPTSLDRPNQSLEFAAMTSQTTGNSSRLEVILSLVKNTPSNTNQLKQSSPQPSPTVTPHPSITPAAEPSLSPSPTPSS